MPKKEPMVPLSDVVHLLSGRKPARKKKRAAKKKAASAAPAPFTNRPGYQGFSAFSATRMIPSTHQQFIQPPPQVIRPVYEAEKSHTININSNFDPDRRKVEVVTDSKSGVLPVEMNPNDIVPRIAQHRLIMAEPSLLNQKRITLPPVQEPFQPQNPAGLLGTRLLSREAIPSAPYDPLRPTGRMPMLSPFPEEEMLPPLDPGKLETEQQFEEFYAPPPKRLTKLTRKNPVTGELEQYRRGGVLKRQDGGYIIDKRVVIPPGNPREHLRGRPYEDIFA